jgi:hypothetical protein
MKSPKWLAALIDSVCEACISDVKGRPRESWFAPAEKASQR